MRPFYYQPDTSEGKIDKVMDLFKVKLNLYYGGYTSSYYGVNEKGKPFNTNTMLKSYSGKTMINHLGENRTQYKVSADTAIKILSGTEKEQYVGVFYALDGEPDTKHIVDQFNLKYSLSYSNVFGKCLWISNDGQNSGCVDTDVIRENNNYKELGEVEFAIKLGYSLSHSPSSTMSSTLELKANEMYFDKLNVTSTLKDIEAAKKISKTLELAQNNIAITKEKLNDLCIKLDRAYANKNRDEYKKLKSDLKKLIDYISANSPHSEFIELGKTLIQEQKEFDPKEYLAS